jgi:broad specificity phosphatase PhoE
MLTSLMLRMNPGQEAARRFFDVAAAAGAKQVKVASNLRSLFHYLIDNQYIEEITDYHPDYLRIYRPDALAKLQSGDSRWERMVLPEVVRIIKEREFFGYRRPIAA